MKHILTTVQAHIAQIPTPHTFLLAISGGSDSMVLLDIFIKLKATFQVAFVNYGFRSQSNEEQQLVASICHNLNIPFHYLKLNGYESLDKAEDKNLQSFAREARYAFFNKICTQEQLAYIVTAHHALDNIETVLMNILHSSSFLGLRGMNILEKNIFRPLLNISKEDIQAYAEAHKVKYFIDHTNLESQYKRNFLRNEVLPIIEQKIPQVKKNIQNNISNWSHIISFYQKMILNHIHNHTHKDSEKQIEYFKYKRLLRHPYPSDIIHHLLIKYHFNTHQVSEFQKLLEAQNGAILENDYYQFIKDNDRISIVNKAQQQQLQIYTSINVAELNTHTPIIISQGQLSFECKLIDANTFQKATFNDNNFYINAELLDIDSPLIIRNHIPGDYFYPFGLNKKKKISKYLIDKKVPITERTRQIVIAHKDYILCVLSFGIDHRFRVQDSTQKILHIHIMTA